MSLDIGERLMSITDLSEMLGVPIHTLYRWRHQGEGAVGYRIGRHVKYRRATVEAWLRNRRTSAKTKATHHIPQHSAAYEQSQFALASPGQRRCSVLKQRLGVSLRPPL